MVYRWLLDCANRLLCGCYVVARWLICGCYMVDWWLQDSYIIINRLLLGGCLVVAGGCLMVTR